MKVTGENTTTITIVLDQAEADTLAEAVMTDMEWDTTAHSDMWDHLYTALIQAGANEA